MSYSNEDFKRDLETDFSNARRKTEQKKKIRELMDKYGDSREAIEARSSMSEWMDFVLSDGDTLFDEVRRELSIERRQETSYGDVEEVLKAQRRQRDREAGAKKDNSAYSEHNFIDNVMKPVIEKNEGIYAYPYVDTAGNVTVGPGVNVETNSAGVEWYLLDPKTGKTKELDPEKEEDLAVIKQELANLDQYKGKNYKADFFENKTNLRISQENANALYAKNVKKAIAGINEIIDDFNAHDTQTAYKIDSFEKLPENVQIVLVDMIYNLGKTGFDWKSKTETLKNGEKKTYGYPQFWRELASRNISGMVKECLRNKEDSRFADRNKATQELLRKTPKDWSKKALKK